MGKIKLAFAPPLFESDLSGSNPQTYRDGLQKPRMSQQHDNSLEAVDE